MWPDETAAATAVLFPPVSRPRAHGAPRDGGGRGGHGGPALPAPAGHRRRARRGSLTLPAGRLRRSGLSQNGAAPALARGGLLRGCPRRGVGRDPASLRDSAPAPRGAPRQERLRLSLGVRAQLDRPRHGAGPAPRRLRVAPRTVHALLLGALERRPDDPAPRRRRADPDGVRVADGGLRPGNPDDAPGPRLRLLAELPPGARRPRRGAARGRSHRGQLPKIPAAVALGARAHRRDGLHPRGDAPGPFAHQDLRHGGLRGRALRRGQPALFRSDPAVDSAAGAQLAAHGDPRRASVSRSSSSTPPARSAPG